MIDAERKVKAALLKYQVTGGKDVNAGYNIIRYLKQGRINIDSPDFAQDFVAWHPLPVEYLVLRLAKAGKLSYRKLPEEMLTELES